MFLKKLVSSMISYVRRPTRGELLKWKVEFDPNHVKISGPKAPSPFNWENVQRIAYRTTASGSSCDYFLCFQVRGSSSWIMLEFGMEGVVELARYVDSLPGTQLGPEGTLANSTQNRSIVVWPSREAGRPIDESCPVEKD